jgi:class 3 adenylate cyclase/tetratricopeptide (TPR) repeat protein
MSFLDTVLRAKTYLEGQGRVSLSALKLEFDLDDARLGWLIEELVDVQQVAAREGKILSWVGSVHTEPSAQQPTTRAATPQVSAESAEAERRHLTVMFCDIVGSTDLSQRLDAEDLRDVVRAYQESASQVIERYAGHIAQYLGDGLLVYFGYPQAHEEDAERAVRAGREILTALETLNETLERSHGIRLAARVGIHTGSVVVGEMGGGEKKEVLALSDTPNIAARLEGFAEPGTVVVSDATLRLVARLFVTEDRGIPELRGISEPIRVHRVLDFSGVTGRLDRAPILSSFVGREQELGLLLDRFEQAQQSQGQAVLIGGEAGIGKSRLVRRFREQLRETPHTWLECRTSPYTLSSALYPVVEMIEGALDFSDEDTSEQKFERLERGLADIGLDPAKTAPLFASLLSLRLPERYVPLDISPQLQRQRTFETLLAWLLALNEEQPVVLVVEDLHWIDPSTLEWLGLVIGQCPTANVLLLLTYRPNFEPPWPGRGHLHPIMLSRLSSGQSRDLVARATPETALPQELIEHIARRSDGVPLFVEELAKGVVASGRDLTSSLSGLEIPETLQDSLMARLDRLGKVKQMAQFGAAVGREFPYALLEAITPMKEGALREGLGRLVEAELVFQRGLPPKATYTFKHALLQDTAYQSLLRSQRTELHGRIADALEKYFPERVAREPEVLARHSEEAGRMAQAAEHYGQAGKRAAQRWAHAEAVAHLQRAVTLLRPLLETPERNHRELQILIELGPSLGAAKGNTDPEVGRVYGRARELCQQVGGRNELLQVLVGLSAFHQLRGELQTSYDLGEEALGLAEQKGELLPLLGAHAGLGFALANMGKPRLALEHLEQAIDLSDLCGRSEHRSGRLDHVRSYAARTLFLLGYPDRARRMICEAVELSREGDPATFALLLAFAATLHYRLRERDQTRELAEDAIAIAHERAFPFPLALATAYRGWAIGGSQGLEEIQRALAQFVALGGESSRPHGLLADAYQESGRTEDALAELDAAFASRSETRTFDAELHRVKGEVFLHQEAADEAERCFRQAIEVAREQEAKSLELRAVTSLARLLQAQGSRDEARALLQPVYDWFTEGFDTKDLMDAKALLEENLRTS